MAEQKNSTNSGISVQTSFKEVYNMALEEYPVKVITFDEDEDPVDINERPRLAWMKGFVKAKTLYRNGKD